MYPLHGSFLLVESRDLSRLAAERHQLLQHLSERQPPRATRSGHARTKASPTARSRFARLFAAG